MDISINNMSFKATLKPTFVINNTKRFENISRQFAYETMQFPEGIFDLYMSETKDKSGNMTKMALHIIKNIKSASANNVYITDNFNKCLETMTDSQIAKRFAKVFKILHYKDLLNKRLPEIKEEYERLIDLIKKLKPVSTSGKEKELLEQLETKIDELQKKYNDINKIAKKNIKNAIRGNFELKEFAESNL